MNIGDKAILRVRTIFRDHDEREEYTLEKKEVTYWEFRSDSGRTTISFPIHSVQEKFDNGVIVPMVSNFIPKRDLMKLDF